MSEHIKDLLALAEAIRQMTTFQIIAVLIGIYIFRLPAIMRERRQLPATAEPMQWPELTVGSKLLVWCITMTVMLPSILTAALQGADRL